MTASVPELHKKPGVSYAFTDDGLELPVIDITHPAFELHTDPINLDSLIDAFIAGLERGAKTPAAVMQAAAQRSILLRGMLESADTYTTGVMTYLHKLGPENLGDGYATPVDRQWAAGLTPLTFRWRMRDVARLLAEGLAPQLLEQPGAPLDLINIGGGPGADSFNALLLLAQRDVGLLTGYELVAMGRHPHTGRLGQLSEHDHRLVRQAIDMVGAQRLASRTFSTLSDGERQKIMIARALAQEPDLLVLDEPTAFLDLPRRVECMALLRDLARRTRCAILLSTHDLDLALRCANHIWLLPYSGQLQVGAPEDLVLNGAFEAAFHSVNVTFDMLSGGFRPVDTPLRHVMLVGEGIHYVWTKRALERAGFAVAAAPQAGLPIISVDVMKSRWQLTNRGESEYCHSIGEVVTTLSSMLA